MVLISFYGNSLTDSLSDSMEILVGDIVREHPLTTIDFIIIIGLLSIVIYLIRYIRRHK